VRETEIEDGIIRSAAELGFPGALAIRNVRVHTAAGRVDVMLLPKKGAVRLVLVEAKLRNSRDSASKVIGQLLMYYGGALRLGSKG